MVQYWCSAHTSVTWDYFCKGNKRSEGYARIKESRVKKMQPGDSILFYITGEKKFAGYAKITGGFYRAESEHHSYPCRIPIEMKVVLPQDRWIPIQPLLTELSFPKEYPNKGGWGLFFRTEPNAFNEMDGKLICRGIDKAFVMVPKIGHIL